MTFLIIALCIVALWTIALVVRLSEGSKRTDLAIRVALADDRADYRAEPVRDDEATRAA